MEPFGGPHLDGGHRVLVGFDRHPASHRALQVAIDLAVTIHAQLFVLHVIDLQDYPIDPDSADWDGSAEQTIAQERREAEAMLADSTLEWVFDTARDEPAHALAQAAHDLDVLFIIVGASRRGLGARLLHGSVPEALVRKQRKPVLVVPAAAPNPVE